MFLSYSLQLDENYQIEKGFQAGHLSVSYFHNDLHGDFKQDFDDFLAQKATDFAEYDSWEKQTKGEMISLWRESLPEELCEFLMADMLPNRDGNGTCATALPFCTDAGLYVFPAGVNTGVGEPGPEYQCLSTTPNPAWYYFRISTLGPAGNLVIHMYSRPERDIDFCCWGPFDDPVAPCPNGLTLAKVVDCSYSGSHTEDCIIDNAQQGKYYLMMITNFSNNACNIYFEKSGGSAFTDCAIMPPLISYNDPLCYGNTLQLTAEQFANATYRWTGPGGWSSNSRTPSRPNATMAISGTYNCVMTIDGVQSDPISLDVNVFARPTANYTFQSACAGEPVSFTCTSTTTPANYPITSRVWDFGDGTTGNGATPTHVYTNPGTYSVELTVKTGEESCTSVKRQQVVVYANPNADAGANRTINYGATTMLNGSAGMQGSFTYEWSPTASVVSPHTASTLTRALTRTTTFELSVRNTQGNCTDTDQVTVFVNGSPMGLTATADSYQVCQGLTTTLHAIPTNGTGTYSYSWSPVDKVNNPNIASPTPVLSVGNNVFTVTVLDGITTETARVTVTMYPAGETQTFDTICMGDTYVFHDQTLTVSGDYTYVDHMISGCDSIINLHLQVEPTYQFETIDTICEGDTIQFFDQILTTTGNYTHEEETHFGCDSIFNLNLVVGQHYFVDLFDTLCSGESIEFLGHYYAATGDYLDTVITQYGCDSVLELHLHVNPVFDTLFQDVICQHETYNLHGFDTVGHFVGVIFDTLFLQTENHCDSIVRLELTVHPVYDILIQDTICQNETYNLLGFDTIGLVAETIFDTLFLQTIDFCDSTVRLELTVNPIYDTLIQDTICQFETFNLNGFDTTGFAPGIIFDTLFLQTVEHCDSTVFLELTVHPVYDILIQDTICQYESYNLYGFDTIGHFAGMVFDTLFLQTVNHCDSIVRLELTVHPVYNILIQDTICQNETYNLLGFDTIGHVAETIFDTLFLQTVDFCDSTVRLELTVNPVYDILIQDTICQNDTYFQLGFDTIGHVEGTIFDTLFLQTVEHCDSTVFLELTVHPVFDTFIRDTICQFDTYDRNGFDIFAALPGWVYDTINPKTIFGCDSIVYLELLIYPTYGTVVHSDTVCQWESYTGYGVHDYAADSAGLIYFNWGALGTNAFGCDSIAYFELTVLPVYDIVFVDTICQNVHYQLHGFDLEDLDVGLYRDTLFLQTELGCDSTIYLELLVNAVPYTYFVDTICQYETYTLHGFDTTGVNDVLIFDTLFLQTTLGCDSIVCLQLMVNTVYDSTFFDTICRTDAYNLHGFDTVGLQTGIIYDTLFLQTVKHCDSTIYLELVVNPIFDTTFTENICRYETYSEHGFFGIEASNVGMIYDTLFLKTIHNCDSIVYLELDVYPVYDTVFREEICQNEIYENHNFGPIETPESGMVYDTLFYNIGNNCDSVVFLELTVNKVYDTTFYEEICQYEIYHGHGFAAVYAPEAGLVHDTLFLHSVHGCDSIIYLELTVNPVDRITFYEDICPNVAFAGHGFYIPPTPEPCVIYDTMYFQNAFGCDSTVYLELTVRPSYKLIHHDEICQNEPYNAYGFSLPTTQVGLVGDSLHYFSIYGCDSVVGVELTVLPVYDTSIFVNACDEYVWNGQTYTESGVYSKIFTSVLGCDSIHYLHLSVFPSYNDTLSEHVCRYEPFVWNGFSFNTEQPAKLYYTLQTISEFGCDSLVTLELTVVDFDTTYFDVEACHEYTWLDSTFFESTSFTQTIQNVYGCDSTVTMNLTIYPSFDMAFYAMGCDSYEWRDSVFYESTIYHDSLISQYGCDSVVSLYLSMSSTYLLEIDTTVCQSFVYEDDTIYHSGVYQKNFVGYEGCDSSIIINLTVNPVYDDTLYGGYLCKGEPFNWHGIPVSTETEGEVSVTDHRLLTMAGCDSTLTMIYHVVPSNDTTLQLFGCDEVEWNGMVFSETTALAINLENQNGCDSIVHLFVEVPSSYNDTIYDAVCLNSEYYFGGQLVSTTVPGQTKITLNKVSQSGCDSIVTLLLEVLPITDSTIRIDECNTFDWNGLVILNDTLIVDTLQSQFGCDSILNYEFYIHHDVYKMITDFACEGEQYDENGFDFVPDSVGIISYQRQSVSHYGCDSIIRLNLTVYETFDVVKDTTVCGSYNGIEQSGAYTTYWKSCHGCDSVVTLNLTVNPLYDIQLHEDICQGETYINNGFVFVGLETGTYLLDTLLHTSKGCDSLVTMQMNVHNEFESHLYDTTCRYEVYEKNGFMVAPTEIGTMIQTQELSTHFGCDSIVRLNLFVSSNYNDTLEVKGCSEEPYSGYNFEFPILDAGEYFVTNDSLQSVCGCDSTVTLHLRVEENTHSAFTIDTCLSYQWMNESFFASGTYVRTFANELGCDSVVTMQLELRHMPMMGEIEGSTWVSVSGDQFSGIHDYSIDSIDGAIAYEWEIDNPYWQLVTNGAHVSVIARTEGAAILTARVYNECGYSESYIMIHATFTDIGESLTEAVMTVKPNPTNDNVNITISGINDLIEVSVYDNNGRKVDGFVVQASDDIIIPYSMKHLAAGLYMFRITDGNKAISTKVIKK